MSGPLVDQLQRESSSGPTLPFIPHSYAPRYCRIHMEAIVHRFIHAHVGIARPLLLAALLALAWPSSHALAAERGADSQCRAGASLEPLPGLSEASGLAVSRRVPGRLWTHNDSGRAGALRARRAAGASTGRRARCPGAAVEDWEAHRRRPVSGGFVHLRRRHRRQRRRAQAHHDLPRAGTRRRQRIGRRHRRRSTRPTPTARTTPKRCSSTPTAGCFIVTKGDTGAVGAVPVPAELRSGATHRLERVGKPRGSGKPAATRRITDGAVSPDGQWVVLRTNAA